MPSSFASGFVPIVELIIGAQPRRLVDIGPGWGKYGLAAREYLPGVIEQVDAVEVTEGRLATQDRIYDTIWEGDVRALDAEVWDGYDLALLVDVIEHMTVDEGTALAQRIVATGCQLVVSTPRRWIPQDGEALGNPFETHVSLWDRRMLAAAGHVVRDLSTRQSWIVLLGSAAPVTQPRRVQAGRTPFRPRSGAI